MEPDIVILGIRITTKDNVRKNVFYDRVLNINGDMRVPLHSSFNSSDFFIPIETDFTERIYIYQYMGVNDIIKSVGGINAFIFPILALATPYFVIYFLHNLSKIFAYRYE